MKKSAIVLLIFPLAFLYSVRMGSVNAEGGDGYHHEETIIQYHCDSATDFDMPVTIKGEIPDSVAPGEEFELKDSSTTVTLPAKVGKTLKTLFQTDSIKGQATVFNISSSNMDSTVNVAKDPIDIPETTIQDDYTATFSVPGTGGIDAGPFTAGDNGEMTFTAGDIDTNVVVAQGPLAGTPIPASCAPTEDATITTVPIKEDSGGDEDTEKPVITLNGDNPMELEVGEKYDEPGATAEDDVDGNLTDDIDVSGDVNTDKAGKYTVTYTVSDKAGNEAKEKRTVKVTEPDQGGGDEGDNNQGGLWYTGEGTPGNDDLGDKGDLYLDTKTGDVYKKGADGWGADPIMNIIGDQGNPGENGEPGEPGEPGDDGEQGPKGDKGDQGPIGDSGSMWYTNEGEPDADLGDEGDLYLNTKNDDVYQKKADGWEKIANLKGALGPKGDPGQTGNCDCDNGSGNGDTDNNDNGGNMQDGGGVMPVTASNLPFLGLVGALMAVAGSMLIFRRKKSLN